jgi:hypothetical protein
MSVKRKATSKKLRFEVFKRDHFTCQYCGSQPPTVVLVCDHITPVKEGGKTTVDNLLTSCESCNQGKGAELLSAISPRPDADLLALEVQQEIAEIDRYQKSVEELAQKRLAMANTLQECVWFQACDLEWCPSDATLIQLLSKFPLEICEKTIWILAEALEGQRIGESPRKWIPYMYGIANKLARAEDSDEMV